MSGVATSPCVPVNIELEMDVALWIGEIWSEEPHCSSLLSLSSMV